MPQVPHRHLCPPHGVACAKPKMLKGLRRSRILVLVAMSGLDHIRADETQKYQNRQYSEEQKRDHDCLPSSLCQSHALHATPCSLTLLLPIIREVSPDAQAGPT